MTGCNGNSFWDGHDRHSRTCNVKAAGGDIPLFLKIEVGRISIQISTMASALIAKLAGPISSQSEICAIEGEVRQLIKDVDFTLEEQDDLYKRISDRNAQWKRAERNVESRIYGVSLPGSLEAAIAGMASSDGSETGSPSSPPSENSFEVTSPLIVPLTR